MIAHKRKIEELIRERLLKHKPLDIKYSINTSNMITPHKWLDPTIITINKMLGNDDVYFLRQVCKYFAIKLKHINAILSDGDKPFYANIRGTREVLFRRCLMTKRLDLLHFIRLPDKNILNMLHYLGSSDYTRIIEIPKGLYSTDDFNVVDKYCRTYFTKDIKYLNTIEWKAMFVSITVNDVKTDKDAIFLLTYHTSYTEEFLDKLNEFIPIYPNIVYHHKLVSVDRTYKSYPRLYEYEDDSKLNNNLIDSKLLCKYKLLAKSVVYYYRYDCDGFVYLSCLPQILKIDNMDKLCNIAKLLSIRNLHYDKYPKIIGNLIDFDIGDKITSDDVSDDEDE